MQDQETIEFRVFHPKQIAPTARKNRVVEGLVRDVVSHSSLADLRMRFFGNPNVEAIPGRITGSIPHTYERPRDTVIVAFENQRPVGYTDISRLSGQTDAAEIAMLVRTDRQRRGIGKAMMQAAVRELRAEGIKQLEAYIHPENSKMIRALQKWSRTEELQDVTFRRTVQQGEVVYFIELEAKK
jgi:RimJ/RimL family protein N-acetyltransferase